MNILITGAKGFIGKNLTTYLNYLRQVVDNPYFSCKDLNILEFDKETNLGLLDEYCQVADFVFHLAGINRPKEQSEFMTGNLGIASTLLNSLRKHRNKCPVMLASSIQANLEGRFVGSEYGKSKKAVENLFFDYSLETGAKVLVYRFVNVFGKWCRPEYNSVIATFCSNSANDIPIKLQEPSVQMDVVYIDDLMDEMLRAVAGRETKEGAFCTVPIHYRTTLGFIAQTIESFPSIRESLGVPNLADPLVSKLFSTWLSYLPNSKFIYNLKTNSDERGSFTEIVRTVETGQVSVNISKPGIVKGNHWHISKSEKFFVVKGTGLVQLRKVGKDEDGSNFPVIDYFVNGNKMQVVEIIPGYSHRIINLSETEDLVTIVWSSECFNPDEPDTYFEKV